MFLALAENPVALAAGKLRVYTQLSANCKGFFYLQRLRVGCFCKGYVLGVSAKVTCWVWFTCWVYSICVYGVSLRLTPYYNHRYV